MPITVVFDPPLPSDSPEVFNSKAFSTLGDLNDWSTEANALASDVTAKQTTASNAATTATTQAGIATSAASTASTKASEAVNARDVAVQAASDAEDAAAAAALFDPASYVPKAGNVTMTGPLSVPAGASGAQVPQAQEVVLRSGAVFGENLLINPNFRINQLEVSGTVVLSAGAYGHDGWKAGAGGCTYTFSTASNGITTVTISAGTLVSPIEAGWVHPGSYTLSWTGTAQGRIGGGSYSASPVTTTLSGGVASSIEFGVGTLQLPQLEFGSQAGIYRPRRVAWDLLLCQRYRFKTFLQGVAPAQNAGLSGAFLVTSFAAGGGGGTLFFPTEMYTSPTIFTYNPSASNANWRDFTNSADRGIAAAAANSPRSVDLRMTSSAAAAAYNYIHVMATALL